MQRSKKKEADSNFISYFSTFWINKMSKQMLKGTTAAKVKPTANAKPKLYCRERILALSETNFFVNSQVDRMDYKQLKKEFDEGYEPPSIIGHQ